MLKPGHTPGHSGDRLTRFSVWRCLEAMQSYFIARFATSVCNVLVRCLFRLLSRHLDARSERTSGGNRTIWNRLSNTASHRRSQTTPSRPLHAFTRSTRHRVDGARKHADGSSVDRSHTLVFYTRLRSQKLLSTAAAGKIVTSVVIVGDKTVVRRFNKATAR
jgi:hypothetical protein